MWNISPYLAISRHISSPTDWRDTLTYLTSTPQAGQARVLEGLEAHVVPRALRGRRDPPHLQAAVRRGMRAQLRPVAVSVYISLRK